MASDENVAVWLFGFIVGVIITATVLAGFWIHHESKRD